MLQDSQITLFLIQFKEAVSNGRFAVIPRDKNNEFLSRYGLLPKERENIILDLQLNNYSSGPEEDKDYPGEKDIWKFKKNYLNIEIYIKLKLIPIGGGFYAKCLSFHD